MTKLEALKMVRNAAVHADAFGKNLAQVKRAQREIDNDLEFAERSLEFEAYFEMGGTTRRVA